MRALVLILVAGCSSDSSVPSQEQPTNDVACAMTVDDYCASHDCVRALDDAVNDSSLCPASRLICNGYDVIHLLPIDGQSNYYYMDGNLVAFHQDTIAGGSCPAGPATFAEPECNFTDAQPLAVCNQ